MIFSMILHDEDMKISGFSGPMGNVNVVLDSNRTTHFRLQRVMNAECSLITISHQIHPCSIIETATGEVQTFFT